MAGIITSQNPRSYNCFNKEVGENIIKYAELLSYTQLIEKILDLIALGNVSKKTFLRCARHKPIGDHVKAHDVYVHDK